jgi:O-antigen/teichoic acid export membrane protein
LNCATDVGSNGFESRAPFQVGGVLTMTIAIFAMRVSVMACKFALAIFVGRYLDLASLGLYGLAAGAAALGPSVIGMGLVHIIMREAVTQDMNQITDSLLHYWCFTLSLYVLLLILAGLTTATLGLSSLLVLVVAITMFEHLGNDVFQLLSNRERPLWANTNAFIRGAAWILIYIPLAIWCPGLRSIPILLGFWLGGSVLAFLLFVGASRDWPWRAAFSSPLKPSWIATNIRNSFVIYVSDLSFVASQYLDRYLVSLFLGLKLAGVYFLYWSAANAVNSFVAIGVLQIQRPILIKAYHDGGVPVHRQLMTNFMKTTALATAVLSVATGLTFHLLLPFLKQPSVGDYLVAFWLMMVGMAVRNVADCGAMGLFTTRRDKIMSLSNIVAVTTLSIAQLILLPIAGLLGAGAAILITFGGIARWRYKLLFSIEK